MLFPAYAGLFRPRPVSCPSSLAFPRVCGVVPIAARLGRNHSVFSPRMRGCSSRAPALSRGHSLSPLPRGCSWWNHFSPSCCCLSPLSRGCSVVPASAARRSRTGSPPRHPRGCSVAPFRRDSLTCVCTSPPRMQGRFWSSQHANHRAVNQYPGHQALL